MVKSSKKLVCLFLIMCLACSMVVSTSVNTVGAQSTLSPLQNVISEALLKSDEERNTFVNDVLNGTDPDNRIAAAKVLFPDLNESDITTALNAYDSNLSSGQKTIIKTFIDKGLPEDNFDTSSFSDIAKKINLLVNDNAEDSNNFGVKVTVAILDMASQSFLGDYCAVAFDGTANKEEIRFAYANSLIPIEKLNGLVQSIGTLASKNINTFDELLTRAANVINNNSITDPSQKTAQISSFKKFLENYRPYIYTGKYDINPLQKVITEALQKSDPDKQYFIDNVLNGTDFGDRFAAAKDLFPTLNETDITSALSAYDSISEGQKSIIKTFINAKLPTNPDTSSFPDIAKKINMLVNDNAEDSDNFGVRVTVAILDLASRSYAPFGGPSDFKAVVFDGTGNAEDIRFEYNNALVDVSTLNGLINNIGTLKAKGITSFDVLLTRAANVINNNSIIDPSQKTAQISSFKKYLEGYRTYIYTGKYDSVPTATPTTRPSTQPSTNPSGSAATPTSTPTPTAIVTAEPSPSEKPAVNPSDKQITSFSFKGLNPEVKGVIFERLHTIIVKVPIGTDLKSLVPTIEYKADSIKPESGKKRDFRHPVFYMVTAKDKTKTRYVVIVVFGNNKVVEEPREVIPGAGPYGDIYGHWAEDSLVALLESGILSGYPDLSVKPNNNMTRAEVVTILIRALGINVAEKSSFKFKDANKIPSWAAGYIQAALDKKFIQGYPDNTVKPVSNVSRAEFTVMVMKAFGFGESKAFELKYKDAKSAIPDWARTYVAKATELKIINGYNDNTFRPNSFITRAEVSAIIDRCLTLTQKTTAE